MNTRKRQRTSGTQLLPRVTVDTTSLNAADPAVGALAGTHGLVAVQGHRQVYFETVVARAVRDAAARVPRVQARGAHYYAVLAKHLHDAMNAEHGRAERVAVGVPNYGSSAVSFVAQLAKLKPEVAAHFFANVLDAKRHTVLSAPPRFTLYFVPRDGELRPACVLGTSALITKAVFVGDAKYKRSFLARLRLAVEMIVDVDRRTLLDVTVADVAPIVRALCYAPPFLAPVDSCFAQALAAVVADYSATALPKIGTPGALLSRLVTQVHPRSATCRIDTRTFALMLSGILHAAVLADRSIPVPESFAVCAARGVGGAPSTSDEARDHYVVYDAPFPLLKASGPASCAGGAAQAAPIATLGSRAEPFQASALIAEIREACDAAVRTVANWLHRDATIELVLDHLLRLPRAETGVLCVSFADEPDCPAAPIAIAIACFLHQPLSVVLNPIGDVDYSETVRAVLMLTGKNHYFLDDMVLAATWTSEIAAIRLSDILRALVARRTRRYMRGIVLRLNDARVSADETLLSLYLVSELAIDADLRAVCLSKHNRDFHDEIAAALVDLASKALASGLAGNPRSVRIDQHIATQSRLVEETQVSLGRFLAPPVPPTPNFDAGSFGEDMPFSAMLDRIATRGTGAVLSLDKHDIAAACSFCAVFGRAHAEGDVLCSLCACTVLAAASALDPAFLAPTQKRRRAQILVDASNDARRLACSLVADTTKAETDGVQAALLSVFDAPTIRAFKMPASRRAELASLRTPRLPGFEPFPLSLVDALVADDPNARQAELLARLGL